MKPQSTQRGKALTTENTEKHKNLYKETRNAGMQEGGTSSLLINRLFSSWFPGFLIKKYLTTINQCTEEFPVFSKRISFIDLFNIFSVFSVVKF